MKKSNLLFSAVMALAMGSLASCSSDDLVTDIQGQETTVDHDQVRYLNVTIASAGGVGTRGIDGNFETGTAEENKVNSMTFVFYDAAGEPTGQVHKPTAADIAEGTFTPGTGSVNKIWTSTVPVELSQGDNLPAYVMCFINPINDTDLINASLDKVEGIKRQAVVTNGGFPMSNSVYYGKNPITGEEHARMIASPIVTGQLYTNQEDAAKPDAQGIKIFVERYAARIDLTLAPGAILPNEDVEGYQLKFFPEAWRPNAIDQELYAVKRYGLIENGIANYKPGYAALVGRLGDSWWNEPGNYRSYWGCSPSYFENEYPKVSDDITDVVGDNAHTDQYPYDLHYFNYNQIKGSNNGSRAVTLQPSKEWDATSGFNGTFYARETTTAVEAWQDAKEYNPKATIVSAVIVGKYQVTPTDGEALPLGTTFYLYGKTDKKWNLYLDDADGVSNGIKAAMLENQNVVLQEVDGVYTPIRTAENFIVDHPSKGVRDIKGQPVAGRLVALQLKEVPTEALYYYDTDILDYEIITADNLDKVNSNLLAAGYARKYGEGLCYFSIPIEHLGIYKNAPEGEYGDGYKNADGSYNFENCPAGSFGIVRNHAYNININSISGLATALRDENQPIVPPMDEVSYYISARLNILNWRIVPPQSVDL